MLKVTHCGPWSDPRNHGVIHFDDPDPENKTSISIWYNFKTLKPIAFHRYGGRQEMPKPRSKRRAALDAIIAQIVVTVTLSEHGVISTDAYMMLPIDITGLEL